MKFKTLEQTPFEEIYTCFTTAFQNYYVPISDSLASRQNRFRVANVDYSQSWGAFDEGKLIAFVINAIDDFEGLKTAYNTGTGVLKEYRGNQLVDKLYDLGLQQLQLSGIEQCLLEVIDENHRAVKVYKRIGFEIIDDFYSFKINLVPSKKVEIQDVPLSDVSSNDTHYSWDYMRSCIQRAGNQYKCYQVFVEKQPVGFFIINPENGKVAQIESSIESWEEVFNGIGQICETITLINVRSKRVSLLHYLKEINANNIINQYLMKRNI